MVKNRGIIRVFLPARWVGVPRRSIIDARLIGTVAVSPMVFCEAFLPSARRLFHQPIRFPIADAHYAMGFAFLYELTSDPRHLQRATHFLDELVASRCSDFKEYCWGYPFNWVWRGGVIKEQTPLITTTPYCYEAFLQVAELLESEVRDQKPEVSPRANSASRVSLITEYPANHCLNRATRCQRYQRLSNVGDREQLLLHAVRLGGRH